MIKKLIKRLRSISGESLVESMASVLIFTLASIALLSMITAAARINGEAREADELHQQQMLVAEEAGLEMKQVGEEAQKIKDSRKDGTVKITFSNSNLSGTTIEKDVYVYQAEDGALFSYFLK